ncbi:HTH_Tnp_Tc3_2 domain-containing protein [Trichonephila clavipes]|nr:HTH_Tnp_Tc3_2 domain-containing protein [Trichonephila clavipes]
MAVSRIWNRWVQDGNTERHAGSQRPPINSSREDRHVTRMALMDRAATSRALSQELGSFARQQGFALAVRQRFFFLQHGLSARRPWLRLPLMLHHRQERLHWGDERRTWCTNGETSFFQMSPGSICSTKMVASLFGGIVVNAHWQRVFEQCTLHFWFVATHGSTLYSSPAKPYV